MVATRRRNVLAGTASDVSAFAFVDRGSRTFLISLQQVHPDKTTRLINENLHGELTCGNELTDNCSYRVSPPMHISHIGGRQLWRNHYQQTTARFRSEEEVHERGIPLSRVRDPVLKRLSVPFYRAGRDSIRGTPQSLREYRNPRECDVCAHPATESHLRQMPKESET